jgi:hypothetical protein
LLLRGKTEDTYVKSPLVSGRTRRESPQQTQTAEDANCCLAIAHLETTGRIDHRVCSSVFSDSRIADSGTTQRSPRSGATIHSAIAPPTLAIAALTIGGWAGFVALSA